MGGPPVAHEKTLWTLALLTLVAVLLVIVAVRVAFWSGLWWHAVGLLCAAAVLWGMAGVIYRDVIEP